MFLLSAEYVNNQLSLLHNDVMTLCDKKPRGKVGGSAISVYQALLHTHREPGYEASYRYNRHEV